jgi:putative chitinase
MTPTQIATSTGARIDRAQNCAAGLNTAMQLYGIDTPARQAMFLANIGVETGGLKWLSEIWGPTPTQRGYEGRADLGNTQTGDGRRFAGHGMLQTTGRFNHIKVRDRLRARFPDMNVPDFEQEPEKLAEPAWAALSAADYADMCRLNLKADAGDFLGYCIGINGRNKATGLPNGWDERQALFAHAQKVIT